MAAIVALQHHEKWDGTGYPACRQGKQIHIFSRITAVADVFDALATERVYKAAWPIEKITALFREESGQHFDPDIVGMFFKKLLELLVIREQFA